MQARQARDFADSSVDALQTHKYTRNYSKNKHYRNPQILPYNMHFESNVEVYCKLCSIHSP